MNIQLVEPVEMKKTREGWGHALVELGEKESRARGRAGLLCLRCRRHAKSDSEKRHQRRVGIAGLALLLVGAAAIVGLRPSAEELAPPPEEDLAAQPLSQEDAAPGASPPAAGAADGSKTPEPPTSPDAEPRTTEPGSGSLSSTSTSVRTAAGSGSRIVSTANRVPGS